MYMCEEFKIETYIVSKHRIEFSPVEIVTCTKGMFRGKTESFNILLGDCNLTGFQKKNHVFMLFMTFSEKSKLILKNKIEEQNINVIGTRGSNGIAIEVFRVLEKSRNKTNV